MFWKSKSKDTQQNSVEVTQPVLPVTEQPFFNVMPRTRVTVVTEPSTPSAAPSSAAALKSEPPPVLKQSASTEVEPLGGGSNEIRVTTPPTPPTVPPVVTSSPEDGGAVVPKTKRAVKVIAIVFCIALAGFAAWYATRTVGPSVQIAGVTGILQRLSFWKGKTTTTPLPAPRPNPTPTLPVEPAKSFETTAEWRVQYFNNADCDVAQCGDEVDPDEDGLTNLKEFQLGTNPINADTDADGLVDGDEVNVFGCSPLDIHTAGDAAYTDADDLKGGWDCGRPTGSAEKMTEQKLQQIQTQTAAHPLHDATMKTLGEFATQYQSEVTSGGQVFDSPPSDVPAVLPSGFDATPQSLLERDLQRLGTIKKVGVALVKYRADNQVYPDVTDFAALVLKLKAYITVATNAQDPVNKAPFVYTYDYLQDGQDFDLTYYSETQKQLIRYTSAQAKKDAEAEGAVSRDGQRIQDLEKIRSALLIYSAATVQSSKNYNFPQASQYKQKMVPQYMKALPVDPTTGKDYEYSASKDGATFTLRVPLENPASGTSGYACNQDACQTY